MSDNFQQTVDLRGKMERQKKAAPPKTITPLEEIYRDENEIKSKTDLKKISQPKVKKSREGLIKLIVFILAVLVVGATVYFLFFRAKGWFYKPNAGQAWYAVKLVNGETFYGRISDIKADPIVMSNVYYNYDQAKQNTAVKDQANAVSETGNLRLVKRGQETHGPAGTMDIVRSQVLFMEPMKSDSKVLQAILGYEK